MHNIVFLLGDSQKARNDNHQRLPQAFQALGWQVTLADHDSVRLHAGEVRIGVANAATFQLIWPLGFGRQATFMDRVQLLDLIDATKFVTAPRALALLHGKFRWSQYMPPTHASSDLNALTEVLRSGGDWVLKPTAGSYAEGVRLIRAGDDPMLALQALGGADPAGRGYVIAQRFLPEVASGETRTLVAGGKIVGSYLRVPSDGLRASLAAGGVAQPTTVDEEQLQTIKAIATELGDLGAHFAAIDLVGHQLIEVNIANPGGLETLGALYGGNFAERAAQHMIARLI